MSDLISREAAIDALGERPMLWVDDDNYTLGARNQYDSNRLAIETVPSVDAVPVVHGKWVDDSDPLTLMCGVCGYRVMRYNNTKFCPDCGAKMDGRNDGDETD